MSKKIIKQLIKESIKEAFGEREMPEPYGVSIPDFKNILKDKKVSEFVDEFLSEKCFELLAEHPYDPYDGWPVYDFSRFVEEGHDYELLDALIEYFDDLKSKYPNLGHFLGKIKEHDKGNSKEMKKVIDAIRDDVKLGIDSTYIVCLDIHKEYQVYNE
jgi:hypothetical protein